MKDPRDLAVEKFEAPGQVWSALDVLLGHATDPPLAIATLLDALRPAMSPGNRICELGFGAGWLLDELARAAPDVRLYGLDLSREHIAMLGADAASVLGDMEHLPFRAGAFDAIVTCWTLYFMRDIPGALAGMRACLQPGGTFVAATTAPDHMLEFEELVAKALASVSAQPEDDISARFNTANGLAYVRGVFPNAELRAWNGTLTIDDPALLDVLWPGYGPQHLDAATNAAARAEFLRLAAERIERDGTLVIRRHDGAFVATRE